VGACIVGQSFEMYDLAEDGGLELYNVGGASFGMDVLGFDGGGALVEVGRLD
jgi:hypothetical protein